MPRYGVPAGAVRVVPAGTSSETVVAVCDAIRYVAVTEPAPSSSSIQQPSIQSGTAADNVSALPLAAVTVPLPSCANGVVLEAAGLLGLSTMSSSEILLPETST